MDQSLNENILVKERSRPNKWVKLNVGGTIYMTTKSTLCSSPDSFLTRICEENSFLESDKDENDAYLIDRDGEYFSCVLNFLRHNKVILNKNLTEEGLLEEAEFYNLPDLIEICKERIIRKEQQKKRKIVYRLLQCEHKELAIIISNISDGWEFVQFFKISEYTYLVIVSCDSTDYSEMVNKKV